MEQQDVLPVDMRVLMEQIYQYKKGVRRMALYTFHKRYADFAVRRLEHQNIDYLLQGLNNDRVNLYFGRPECIEAIRLIVQKPLSELTPEEDFILGTMLGYDVCAQCERYCSRKKNCKKQRQEQLEAC